MLGHFPDPYPNESFYSICARFAEHMQYSQEQYVALELFNTPFPNVKADHIIPFDDFVKNLPPNCKYSANYFIENHTLLPLFKLFMPVAEYEAKYQQMKTQKVSKAGIYPKSLRVNRGNYMRFCPVCVEEDRQKYGECYWHRDHQVPGVFICAKHAVWLQEGNTLSIRTASMYVYRSAESTISLSNVNSSSLNNKLYTILFNISRDVNWLLGDNNIHSTSKEIEDKYKYHLYQKKLAYLTGNPNKRQLNIRIEKLKDSFEQFLTDDGINLLGINLRTKYRTWLDKLTHYSLHASSHPIYHLLLIQFLELSTEEFFTSPINYYKPFGEGPWPCLNPICHNYLKPCITKCEIATPKGKAPRGIFTCKCGFKYQKTMKDDYQHDQLLDNNVLEKGALWENIFRDMWNTPSISLAKIMATLKISSNVTKRYALQLNLQYPRTGMKKNSYPQQKQHSSEQKRLLYREMWLSEIENKPDIPLAEIRKKHINIYSWLWRNDPEWMKAHTPERRKKKTMPSPVNWEEIDTKLAEEIRLGVIIIRTLQGVPAQINLERLMEYISCYRTAGSIRRNLSKLPKTRIILDEVSENFIDIALRRLNWAVNQFIEENSCPTSGQLVKRAKLTGCKNVSPIKEKIAEALHKFKNPLDFN